jgi:hypothetical protein
MQENLDLGVTSVGITLGSSGTDVSVTGSPITTSGNITINFPTASATNRGLLSSADWTTFNDKQPAGNYVTLDTAQTITAQKVFTTSGSSDSVIITHGSGSGFALDVIKAGNGEVVRVNKTSGSGNAMSIIGGNFGAEAATFSGVVTTTPDAVINGVNVGRGGGNFTANTRVGLTALQANTTGNQNTAVGTQALLNNTTAGTNTALGYNALLRNTTGSTNTATGSQSLRENTTGISNTADGALSLYENTTGSNNTAVGYYSLYNNTTGSSNIAIGHASGFYNADGTTFNSITNQSIYIGSGTRALANNQTNQIVIGHNAIGNGSNTVTLGNDSITNTYLKGAVTLNGALNGTSAIFTGSITSYDTLVSRTLTNTTPTLLLSRNNADNGFGVIRVLDGGTISFENGPTGATQTSRLSLDGTTGAATFSSSVGIGGVVATDYGAFRQLAVFGGSTGGGITIASTGTATGVLTFANGTSGTNQFKGIIEYQHATDTMVFGTNAAEKMRITSGGAVGIGTDSPNLSGGASGSTILTVSASASARNAVLELNGTRTNSTDISGYVRFFNNGAATPLADIRAIRGSSDTSGDLAFTTADTERMRITSGGILLIGKTGNNTDDAGLLLYQSGVINYVQDYSSGTINYNEFFTTGSGTVRGSITYNGTITSYNSTSDYRLKEDLQDYNGLEIVSKLKTYDFNWKEANVRDYGMIAHELQEVLPSYVNGEKDAVDEDGNIKAQGVDYSKIVPILIKAIQEQQEQIDSLKNQIK